MKQKAYLIITSCSYNGILFVLHLSFPRGVFDINSRILIAGAGKFSLRGGEGVVREEKSRFGFGFIIVKDSDSRFEIRLRLIFLDSDSRFGRQIFADKIRIRDSTRISNLTES